LRRAGGLAASLDRSDLSGEMMKRFMIRDLIWLLLLVVTAAAWWWDRSGLANRLKNAQFAIEHQKKTIEELSGKVP
jgi:hypothetical protein